MLASPTVDSDRDLRGLVGENDTTVGLVPMLPTLPAPTGEGLFEIPGIDLELVLLGLRENGNRHRGSVDSAAFLVGGHALESVSAALVAESSSGLFPGCSE